MNILTIVRQVPDSRAAISVLGDASGIRTDGLKWVCDPFDEFGVEQAVRLKESRSEVDRVVAISIGPPDADLALRHALAMGADTGIHVQGESISAHDELYLALALAEVIRSREAAADLILCGKQSIDNDAGVLGPALAEFLGRAYLGPASGLEISDDGTTLRVRRRCGGVDQVLQGTLPALVTCEKGLVEPRYPALPNIIKAKRKPVERIRIEDLPGLASVEPGSRLRRLDPPPPRAPCRMIEGEPEQMARELVRVLREEAKVI